jgi:hypothetical protein
LQGPLDLLIQFIKPREQFILPLIDRSESVADGGGGGHSG